MPCFVFVSMYILPDFYFLVGLKGPVVHIKCLSKRLKDFHFIYFQLPTTHPASRAFLYSTRKKNHVKSLLSIV